MQVKKYLFIISLVFLYGCNNPEPRNQQMKVRLDSMNAVHAVAIDSLQSAISGFQAQIAELNRENALLLDSLGQINKAINSKKSGPKLKMYPGSKGDPIDIPIKK